MKKSVYDIVRKGLQNGVYTGCRLVKINDNKEREIIIPYPREGFDVIARFDFIKFSLEKKIEPGNYIIECKTGRTSGGFTDQFEITIKPPLTVSVLNKEENPVIEPEAETMQNIDFNDYVDLIKECEKLKAQNALLLTQLEMNNKMGTLQDNSKPQTTSEKVIQSLNDNLPVVLGIFDKFMTQREKALELKERELDIKQGVKPTMSNPKSNWDKVVSEMEELYQTDENLFNRAMDELQVTAPDLYDYVCEKMELEEGGEE